MIEPFWAGVMSAALVALALLVLAGAAVGLWLWARLRHAGSARYDVAPGGIRAAIDIPRAGAAPTQTPPASVPE